MASIPVLALAAHSGTCSLTVLGEAVQTRTGKSISGITQQLPTLIPEHT